MWRVPPLEVTDEERQELERRSRAHTSPVRVARRARIILLAADGMPNRQVARRVGIKESYVSLWRRRFASERLAGLEDRPRPGRPRTRSRSTGFTEPIEVARDASEDLEPPAQSARAYTA